MAVSERVVFRAGEVVIDPGRRVVSRRGEIVPLGERGLAALLVLVEHAGEVVSKRQLLDVVWPDAVVSEDSLVKAVAEIRRALDDTAADPRFVQTVHRRGYRFIAPVSVVSATSPPLPAASASTTGNRPRGLRSIALTAAIVLVAAAGVVAMRGFLPWRGSADDAPFRGRPFRKVANLPEGAMKPAFSPRGDLLAVVMVDEAVGEHALWLVKPDSGAPLRLTRGIDVRGPSPSFSADGSRVFFTTYRHDPERGVVPSVLAVPVLGGEPQPVLAGASAASESPDGRALAWAAVGAAGSEIVVRAADGAERVVAESGYWPRWSPDGRWIAYTTSNPEGGEGDVLVVRPDGRDRRTLTTAAGQVYGLCWTPDSRWILFASERHSSGDLWAVSIDGRVETQVTSGPGECSAPAVAADGSTLVFAYASLAAAVYRSDGPGEPPVRVLAEEVVHDLALSPDGAFLAVAAGDLGAGQSVSLLDLASGRRRALSGLDVARVRWSADGSRLLATAPSPDGAATWIWALTVDGGLPTAVVRGTGEWTTFDPAPDGRDLAGVRCRADCELVVVSLADAGERVLAAGGAYDDVRWSPDGRWIAFSGGDRPQDTVSSGVWVVAASGGEPRRLAPDGARLAWLPDSRGLLFARFEADGGLWRVGLDGGVPERVQRPVEDPWGYRIDGLELGRGGAPLMTLLMTESAALYEVRNTD